ncbi:hypothetical protein [Chroococcidiopsis sp.]|uniref:hypothetical protein n=1 Tax=Chroococcidiopsis sp. TaxID=3088168 RepID=UPI003F31A779
MTVLQSRGETIALLQHYYRGRSLSVKILPNHAIATPIPEEFVGWVIQRTLQA